MNRLLSIILLITISLSSFAGGYRVSIQGSRQLGMGHTGVAIFNNPEVLFFNPAGIAFLEKKFCISVGGGLAYATAKYQNKLHNDYFKTDNPTGTPVSLYSTYKINKDISVGLAVYTPYGSSVEWPTDWSGSHLINNIKLQAIYVQPTIAYKISERLSVAAGAIFVTGNMKLNKNIARYMTDEQGNYSDITLDADAEMGFGYSLGIAYKASDKLNIGVSYRSKVQVEVKDGDVSFNQIPEAFKSQIPETKFNAKLPLPAELTVGISYKATEKLLLAFDYNLAFWSAYKTLNIDFTNNSALLGDKVMDRNYKDASTFRVGAEYILNEKFIVRTGAYYDMSPAREGYFNPETPSMNSIGFTAGLTYNINDKFAIDASFLHLSGLEKNTGYEHHVEGGQTTSFVGDYKTYTLVPSFGITYKL